MADLPATSILHLNLDVLLHISEYVDTQSLAALAQTCQWLKFQLDNPIFWRGAVWEDDEPITAEAAETLQYRNLTIVKFTENSLNIKTSLMSIARVDCIETLYIDSDAFESWTETDLDGLDFPSLSCLIFHVHEYDGHPHYVKAKTKTKVKKMSTLLDCFLSKMENLIELHVYQEDNLSAQCNMEVLKSVERYLPNLRDLEYKKHTRKGFMCCDEKILSCSPDAFSYVERLAGIRIDLNNIPNLCPRLRHVDLDCADRRIIARHRMTKIPNIESMTFTGKREKEEKILQLLLSFPKLQALDLRTVHMMSYEAIEGIIETCPQLAVLNISGAIPLSAGTLKSLLNQMQTLEVLILPPTSSGAPCMYDDQYIDQNILCGPKLKSLLGISSDNELAKFSNLKYKSHKTIPNCVVMGCDDTRSHVIPRYESLTLPLRISAPPRWKRLREFSDDWFDAFGAGYFYPKSTFDNRKHFTSKLLLPNIRFYN